MPSKFKPTRERKRKVIARKSASQPHVASTDDSNAAIISVSKLEREEQRQKLRDELRAQQPKVSAKKQKRLDKYIEKKLKKDEAADLVKKLEKEKEKYDPRGLQSSKALKRKFGDYVDGQLQQFGSQNDYEVEEVQPRLNGRKRHAKTVPVDDDMESVDSFEEEHQTAFDPATAPPDPIAQDNEWIKQRAAPVQGTGLAQPLQIGANGIPIIPVWRGRKPVQQPPLEDEPVELLASTADEDVAWEGFSGDEESISDNEKSESESDMSEVEEEDEEDTQELDPRLKNIDSKVLDALLAELERSDGSDASEGEDLEETESSEEEAEHDGLEDEDQEDSSDSNETESGTDAESETSDTSADNGKLKPRTSAFKSWATQQLNQSIGHTPFYEQEQPQQSDTRQVFAKPAAGYRLGVKETERPKDDRRAYTVAVERQDAIQQTRSQLPILQREQEIMEAVHNNAVVVIKGDTGSGKTTQLPQFLFEAGFGDKEGPTPGLIGITQPRRVAAVSMAKRVAEELGNHGDKVAHQIRFDTTVSSKTAIKFMTDGILLRELSQDLLLKKYSAIVVDEAHERSVNTDLLIGMLSKIVPARMRKSEQNPDPRPLKLIIMSATLNINDFLHEKLFAASLRPPVVEAEGRQHKVTTHFALRSRADYVEETIEKVKRAHRKLPKGGILVFLTGQNEIKYVLSQLRKELVRSARPVDNVLPRMQISANDAPLELEDLDITNYDRTSRKLDATDDIDIVVDETELDKEFEVSDDDEEAATSTLRTAMPKNNSKDPYDTVHLLPLYSQLPTKEQLRIFEPPPDRSRLIVLATNVAETSLTIPGIRYVFDCGRSKERKFDTETNVQSFEIDYISKASAQQRAGRAGRTGPGHCWRLYSSAVYEQFFPDHTEPEILRTPAENVVLQLKGFRYPRPVTDFPFPSPPGRMALEKAEKLLRDLGAISGPNGALTELGKSLSLYPLSPRLGKVLVKATAQPKLLLELLAITAALAVDDVFINETQIDANVHGKQDGQSRRLNDHDEEEQKDKMRQQFGRAHAMFSKHDKSSDGLKLLTAVQMFLAAPDKEAFCQQYFLRSKGMQEISQLYGQLRSMVQVNHSELVKSLKDVQIKDTLKADAVKTINTTLSSGYLDQVALRYDLHPTPPALPKQPIRAIDVPYLPLTPLSKVSSFDSSIVDRAVFIHPSSLLSRLSTKSLPEYIVYRHLQTSQAQVLGADAEVNQKTRMIPLCTLDAKSLLALVRDTGLIEYGKPIPKTKIEEVDKRNRVCWVSTEMKSASAGGFGWPLPPTKVKQVIDLKAPSGWRVIEVIA